MAPPLTRTAATAAAAPPPAAAASQAPTAPPRARTEKAKENAFKKTVDALAKIADRFVNIRQKFSALTPEQLQSEVQELFAQNKSDFDSLAKHVPNLDPPEVRLVDIREEWPPY